MKVLITGGAGFIGQHTCHALVKAGHDVRILDVLDPQIHGPDAQFPESLRAVAECIRGDVRDTSLCMSSLAGADAVLHLAARTGVGQSMYDIADYAETNVSGTAALLEAIVKSRASIKRLVLSSSRAVYGEGLYSCSIHGLLHPSLRDRGPLETGDFQVRCPHCAQIITAVPTPETCPTDPLSLYALTKLQQEHLCLWQAKTFGTPVTVLRYFNVYGSGQSLRNPYTGVVSIFFSLLRGNRALSLYEDGLPIRDFVHVSDVVQANVKALATEDLPTDIYNIGSGHVSTIADVARSLGRAIGVEPQMEYRGEYRVGDIFACYADISKAEATLGYQMTMSLQDGMKEFAAWAEHQQSMDLYEKTVRELSEHGLFGRARSHRGP